MDKNKSEQKNNIEKQLCHYFDIARFYKIS